MSLSRARARYLSAMGIVLPSLALAACKDPPPQVATADASPTPESTTSATPTTTAVASATATATTTAVASATATAPEVDLTLRLPRCPSGAFCVPEEASVDAKKAAPAPFARCALTATVPGDTKSGLPWQSRSIAFSEANTRTERAKTPSACCYTWVMPCPGGRAFRDATGTASVARTIDREDWTAALGALAIADLAPEVRASLAEHWTREAAFEHASIASFAQLTLDLLAAGAPPGLLASTQRAALDEIEHAQIAFGLATAYGGGASVGPAALAALPGACRSLAELARSTFIDACVGESVASAVLAENARKAADPALRELLTKMADDEERHAELAWTIVAWALRSGDPEVARAIAAAQADVIDELFAITNDANRAAANELRATVLREIVVPCSITLLSVGDGVSASTRRRQAELS